MTSTERRLMEFGLVQARELLCDALREAAKKGPFLSFADLDGLERRIAEYREFGRLLEEPQQ